MEDAKKIPKEEMDEKLETILDPDGTAAIHNSVWKVLDSYGLEQTKMLQVSLSPSYEEEFREAKQMEKKQTTKDQQEILPNLPRH